MTDITKLEDKKEVNPKQTLALELLGAPDPGFISHTPTAEEQQKTLALEQKWSSKIEPAKLPRYSIQVIWLVLGGYFATTIGILAVNSWRIAYFYHENYPNWKNTLYDQVFASLVFTVVGGFALYVAHKKLRILGKFSFKRTMFAYALGLAVIYFGAGGLGLKEMSTAQISRANQKVVAHEENTVPNGPLSKTRYTGAPSQRGGGKTLHY